MIVQEYGPNPPMPKVDKTVCRIIVGPKMLWCETHQKALKTEYWTEHHTCDLEAVTGRSPMWYKCKKHGVIVYDDDENWTEEGMSDA